MGYRWLTTVAWLALGLVAACDGDQAGNVNLGAGAAGNAGVDALGGAGPDGTAGGGGAAAGGRVDAGAGGAAPAGAGGEGGSAAAPLAIVGSYEDDWGTRHVITDSTWTQTWESDTSVFRISGYDNEQQYVVAQNDAANAFNPDLWSLFYWTVSDGDVWICQLVFDASSEQEALAASRPDASDLTASGSCGAGSWSRLTEPGSGIAGAGGEAGQGAAGAGGVQQASAAGAAGVAGPSGTAGAAGLAQGH